VLRRHAHRQRQETITTERLDIIAGAEVASEGSWPVEGGAR
jgi:F0F1-type ATP synthase gamma subunit